MNHITAIVRGKANDHDKFLTLAEQACTFVEGNEPGVLRYECYVDPETSRFVWHEIYRDGPALLEHVERLMATGVPQQVDEVVDWEGMTVLGDVTDPAVRDVLEGMGADIIPPHVTLVR